MEHGNQIATTNMETSQNIISTSFKIQCLNTTLKFVKDDTQLIIKYPEMTAHQGEFVFSLIRQAHVTNVETDVGFGFKSLYAPLLEAMKVFSIKFKFKVYYAETSGNNTKCVVLEKVPKQNKNESTKYTIPSTSINISLKTNESQNPQLMTKPLKGIMRIQNIIDNTPMAFQIKILQAILGFMEDVLRATLVLYSLTELQADFCIEVIKISNLKSNHFSIPEVSLFLMEKISKVLCKLKKVRTKLGKLDKVTKLRVVTLVKVPFVSNGNVNRQGYENVSTASETTPSKTRSTQKRIARMQNIIDEVSESFQIEALLAVIDFIDDKLQASVVFNNVSIEEAMFYSYVLSFARGEGVCENLKFSERCTDLLNNLDTSLLILQHGNVSVSLKEAKSAKQSQLRHMKFVKVPAYEDTYIPENSPPELQIVANGCDSSRESIVCDQRDRCVNVHASHRQSKSISSSPRNTSSNTRITRTVSNTANGDKGQSVDKRSGDSTINKKGRARSNETGIAKSKHKMMEAMSVPMKSDKAMKMMLSMGWDGGALGARGEGITEPIIPALDLVTRAGLGHVKPTPMKTQQSKKLNNKSRLEVLQALLQLITEETPVIDITCKYQISKREASFLNHVMNAFNLKLNIGLENANEKNMVGRIFEVLNRAPALHLSYRITDDRKKLILKKEPVLSAPKQLAIEQTDAQSCPKATPADVAVQSRVTILKQILGFAKSDQSETEIQFEITLTPRQRKYIEDCVTKINKKNKVGMTTTENDLFEEIANSMEKCYLEGNFVSDKVFILRKIFYKNRFYNSALDSLILNTSNNVISKLPNNNFENGENDKDVNNDEVIIIECDEPAVVISDDESLDEDNLLNSSVELNEAVSETTLQVNESDKTVEEELESDIRELEKAIIEADLSDKEMLKTVKIEPKEDINLFIKESSPNSKRFRSDSECSGVPLLKKYKLQLQAKTVCIVPVNYPEENMSREKASDIQKSISISIDNTEELPLLKCHGVKNGALVYSCHGEKSICFLEKVVKVTSDIKTTNEVTFDEKLRYKMAIKINSFVDENEGKLFKRLELYNAGLTTNDWVVHRREIHCDFLVILVDIDDNSFKFIRNSDFSLFVGIDKAEFSVVWE